MGRDFTLDSSYETTLALCEHCTWRAVRVTASQAQQEAEAHIRLAHGGLPAKRVADAARQRRYRMTA